MSTLPPPSAPFPMIRCAVIASVLTLALAGAPDPKAPQPASPSAPEEAPKLKGGWLYSLLVRPFDPNPDLEMTIITEMTEAGRKLPPPSPEHPVYYQDESSGDREMDGAVAHEQTMPPAEVRPLLVRGLAKNGYQPAQTPDHPPGLIVFYFWGTHNALASEVAEISPNQLRRNVLDRAALVGGKKFSDEISAIIQDTQDWAIAHVGPPPVKYFLTRKPENETLLYQALGDVFYVVASAFDYSSVAKGQPVLLWRTRMTVSSQGVQMKKALPAVVASAGKYFGRETNEPVIIHHSATPDGQVEIGTATVVKDPPDPANSPPAEKK